MVKQLAFKSEDERVRYLCGASECPLVQLLKAGEGEAETSTSFPNKLSLILTSRTTERFREKALPSILFVDVDCEIARCQDHAFEVT